MKKANDIDSTEWWPKATMIALALIAMGFGVYIGIQMINLYPEAGGLQVAGWLLAVILVFAGLFYYFWWGFTLEW